MAYQFEVVGWEDFAGDRHASIPLDTDLPDVAGLFSRFWDDETGDAEHYHWIFTDYPFDSWDDWWDVIAGSMGDHGYAMA
jgi:hypothetical protein